MREAEGEVRSGPQAGRLERLDHPLLALGGGPADVVDLERLGHEVVDRLLWIERLVGVLEDELDAATIGAQPADAPEVRNVLPVERDAARGLPGELDDDAPGRCLAGAGFADERQDFALLDRQVDAVDGADDAGLTAEQRVGEPAADREMDLDIVEAKEFCHGGDALTDDAATGARGMLSGRPPPNAWPAIGASWVG